MPRFLGILIIILGIFSFVTYLLHRFFKNRYIKYIPAVAALLFAIYNFYGVQMLPSEGFQNLARAIMGMMLMVGFLSGGITGVMIDYIIPRRKAKRIEGRDE